MRTPPALLAISLLTSACGSGSCLYGSNYSGCAHWGGDTPSSSPAPTKPLAGDDAVEFFTTEDGTFAIASVHTTRELRTYRLEATGDEEAPLFVTLASKTALDENNAPERRTMATENGTSAWIDDGDAYLGSERIGAPGITRSVALTDVGDLRIVALQTEQPRMLVFFESFRGKFFVEDPA